MDENARVAGEEAAVVGDVQVIEGLDFAGLDGDHLDRFSERSQHVAGLQVAGLRPAGSGSPEAVINACQQDFVVAQRDSAASDSAHCDEPSRPGESRAGRSRHPGSRPDRPGRTFSIGREPSIVRTGVPAAKQVVRL